MGTRDTLAVLSDVHIPFHDPIALGCALTVLREEKPATVYLNGDIVDFYGISAFDKDPRRQVSLQEEIDQTIDFLDAVRRTCPKASIIYVQGNHEDRLRRFLWKTPEVSSIRTLEFDNLMKLSKFKMSSIPYHKYDVYHGTLIMHGKRIGKYASHQNLDNQAMSGISGHTHHLSHVFKTTPSGTISWIESGCLCDLEPDYINGCANWQHGMVLGGVGGDGQLRVRLVQITDGDAFY